MVVIGFVILAVTAVTALATGLANSGSDHTVQAFSILGVESTASSGRVFIYGAITGIVAMVGLDLVLNGTKRGVKRRMKARHQAPAATVTGRETLSERIRNDPSTVAVDEVDARDATGERLTH